MKLETFHSRPQCLRVWKCARKLWETLRRSSQNLAIWTSQGMLFDPTKTFCFFYIYFIAKVLCCFGIRTEEIQLMALKNFQVSKALVVAAKKIPHFYCFPSTTTTTTAATHFYCFSSSSSSSTFLLFSLLLLLLHIFIVSPPPPPPPHFYCFSSSSSSSSSSSFLLFLLLLLLISIAFPRKDQKAKIRPKRPKRPKRPNLEGKQ